MQVAILKDKRYAALTERLRAAGFGPDTNEEGNPTGTIEPLLLEKGCWLIDSGAAHDEPLAAPSLPGSHIELNRLWREASATRS